MSKEQLEELESWLREVLADLAGPAQALRLVLLPVIGTLWVLTVWVDPAPWRIVVGGLALGAVTVLSVGSWWRWRSGLAGRATFLVNAVAMAWIQLLVIGLTGGLRSPLMPVVPVVALQVSATFGPSRERAAVLAGQFAALASFVGCESVGWHLALPGFSVPTLVEVWLDGTAFAVMLVVATLLGQRLRGVVATMIARASTASAGERRAHAEHARELMLLSAEIAHELKNPLASINGLAALLAKDLQGRDAERLAVLRDEVERMKQTLEEFLDFSRPIAPLAVEDVDLAGLAREVAAMSEGLARSRGVTLAVEGEAMAHADRRKLRQVLVNLVQNAIDASPSGSPVQIVLASTPPSFEVRDRGPGFSAELLAEAFEPGVTDKEHGSGLGLTICRALMRQHGGDLTLGEREGGGTVARATLP
ncbi:MAG: HAMP domain-containing histidine kinase [Myxococcales bacterium]|nr:HAMP domain-containing histidine kinase [Myxococcales bacterium]